MSTHVTRLLAALCLLLAAVAASCPPKTVLVFTSDTETQCQPCQDNCAVCYVGLADARVCAFCDDGFYLHDGACTPCEPHCAHCIGPGLANCRSAASGFFYSAAAKRLEACAAGCDACHDAQSCSTCREGFLAVEAPAARADTPLRAHAPAASAPVTCEPCAIDNCLYCSRAADQIAGQRFRTCNLCRQGFGLVSGKCEPCPANCQVCAEETRQCSYCAPGFFVSKPDNACRAVAVPHCYSVDERQQCVYCDSHFFLEEGACRACRAREPHCNYCALKDGHFACLSCLMGYYRTPDGACRACGPHCSHCDAGRCLVCAAGHFFDAERGACEPCALAHCEFCKSATVCEACEQGFFFDRAAGQCARCRDGCLKCSGAGDNCLACPVDHFQLQEEIVAEKRENAFISSLLSLFIGFAPAGPKMAVTEIRVVTKCVRQCPASVNGSPVVVSEAERRCHVRLDKHAPLVQLHSRIEKADILKSLVALRLEYDQQVAAFRRHAKQAAAAGRSAECNFSGVIRKEIRGNLDSYYICRCDEGLLGDNCQIPRALHEKTQTRLAELLNEIQAQIVGLTRRKKAVFLQALVQVNKFKVGLPVLQKMVSLVRQCLEKDHDVDNQKKLYVVYDGILLNLFDLREDLRKLPPNRLNSDADVFELRRAIYELIRAVVQMVEDSLEDHVYANSFLERHSSNYLALDTFSYIMSENALAAHAEERGFVVQNPNIDTSSNTHKPNRVFLAFEAGFDARTSAHNLQVIAFSAALLEEEVRRVDEDALASNVLYLKLTDPRKPHAVVTNKAARVTELHIVFALNFLPAYEDLRANLACHAYDFSAAKDKIIGETVEVDETNLTAKCKFFTYFEFRNYYFAVSVKK